MAQLVLLSMEFYFPNTTVHGFPASVYKQTNSGTQIQPAKTTLGFRKYGEIMGNMRKIIHLLDKCGDTSPIQRIFKSFPVHFTKLPEMQMRAPKNGYGCCPAAENFRHTSIQKWGAQSSGPVPDSCGLVQWPFKGFQGFFCAISNQGDFTA